MKSHLRRVSNEFWDEVVKIHKKNKGMIPKTLITKQIATQIKSNQIKPIVILNNWPFKSKLKINRI